MNPRAIDNRWKGSVAVIVPVYNEVAHIDELLQAIHASPVKKSSSSTTAQPTVPAKNCRPYRSRTTSPSYSTKKIAAKARPFAPHLLMPALSTC